MGHPFDYASRPLNQAGSLFDYAGHPCDYAGYLFGFGDARRESDGQHRRMDASQELLACTVFDYRAGELVIWMLFEPLLPQRARLVGQGAC